MEMDPRLGVLDAMLQHCGQLLVTSEHYHQLYGSILQHVLLK